MHGAESNTHGFSRIFAVFTVFAVILSAGIFFSVFSVNACAYSGKRVYDYGDVLADSEESRLEEQLKSASDNCGHNIFVYTVSDLLGESVSERAQRAAMAADPDTDSSGILFLLAVKDREYDIYAYGEMYENIMSDKDLNRLNERVLPYLKEGDYYGAFSEFCRLSENAAMNTVHGSMKISLTLNLSAFVFAAIIALITVLCMKAGMKTTRPEITAGNYVKSGSFKVTVSRDVYLYTSVSRVKIQSDSRSGHSGGRRSGGSRSGGGRSGGGRSGGHSRGRF